MRCITLQNRWRETSQLSLFDNHAMLSSPGKHNKTTEHRAYMTVNAKNNLTGSKPMYTSETGQNGRTHPKPSDCCVCTTVADLRLRLLLTLEQTYAINL